MASWDIKKSGLIGPGAKRRRNGKVWNSDRVTFPDLSLRRLLAKCKLLPDFLVDESPCKSRDLLRSLNMKSEKYQEVSHTNYPLKTFPTESWQHLKTPAKSSFFNQVDAVSVQLLSVRFSHKNRREYKRALKISFSLLFPSKGFAFPR